MRHAKATWLWFDPWSVSAYTCAADTGLPRHRHIAEPCHLTIVAAGAVEVTTYDMAGNPVRTQTYAAPAIIDYDNGTETHHQLRATVDGTVFYNLPRLRNTEALRQVAEALGVIE